MFGFHRLWYMDDKDIHTEHILLKSTEMAERNEKAKTPINKPAEGLRKSQINCIGFYSAPGIQHISVCTHDIIAAVSNMKKCRAEFLCTPKAYYDDLRHRLKK